VIPGNMYDRYKTRRRKTGIYKAVVVLACMTVLVFLGVRYERYIAFWKYNQSKLFKEIEAAKRETNPSRKRDMLKRLADTMDQYEIEHQTDPEAFYLSGKVHYLIGETYLPADFSNLVINDGLSSIGRDSKREFVSAIRDIKKGFALDNAGPDEEYRIILAQSCLYSDYSSPAEIYRIIQKGGDPEKLADVENVRFYAYINIINKREDYGLALLSRRGMISDNIKGLLFYATAEKIAKKFTRAIQSYKNVLARTMDDKIQKLVHVNLGKIYFSQSLYRESLEQFNLALKNDDRDVVPKIWIGKNYSAMGEKNKARAIWSEVLTNDGTNVEVKALLKAM
jgi:tetratricopeptide (TPR) repeat protein